MARVVCFYSDGSDQGLDLSASKHIIEQELIQHKIPHTFYTPQRLKDLHYDAYVKSYPLGNLRSMNPCMNFVGFSAWKPLIMLLELATMNEGDVLVYRDCNCLKYPTLKDYHHFQHNVDETFRIVNFDFVVTVQSEIIPLGRHCKRNVIDELAIEPEFTRRCPLMIANCIMCRKSSVSIAILQEWAKHCLHEPYIDNQSYGSMYPEFQWHTYEQTILNVLLTNYMVQRKFNIPANYPNLMFMNRDIQQRVVLDS